MQIDTLNKITRNTDSYTHTPATTKINEAAVPQHGKNADHQQSDTARGSLAPSAPTIPYVSDALQNSKLLRAKISAENSRASKGSIGALLTALHTDKDSGLFAMLTRQSHAQDAPILSKKIDLSNMQINRLI